MRVYLIWIHSDICSNCFFYTNSFVSFFYTKIFRLIFNKNYFTFVLSTMFYFHVVSHIKNATSNIKSNTNIKNLIWIYSYIRIFSDTNIRSYHIRIICLIRIYSDIRSYHFFDTNIFGYSFVSFFGYKYIRIFIRIENLYSPHPASEELFI